MRHLERLVVFVRFLGHRFNGTDVLYHWRNSRMVMTDAYVSGSAFRSWGMPTLTLDGPYTETWQA